MCFTLALEWSQTSLRQESAESLSTPSLTSAPMVVDFRLFVFTPQVLYIHPLPPVSGGESVTTENTAQADCPPETGATRSEATEGVDKSLNSHPLTVKEQFSVLIRLCRLFLLVARHNKSNNFASALASCVGSPLPPSQGGPGWVFLSLSYIPCLSIFLYNA